MRSDSKNILDIRQEYLLPGPVRLFGFALLIIGSTAFVVFVVKLLTVGTFSYWVAGAPVIAVVGAMIGLAHYRLMIDPGRKLLNVYVWNLGFRNGKPEPFDHIQKIYLNRVLQSTRMSSYTGHPHELKEYLFKAFILLDDGEKIHLDTDEDHDRLMDRVNVYAVKLEQVYPAKTVFPAG